MCMALKALLCSCNDASPQHWSVLRAIHTFNTPQNYISLGPSMVQLVRELLLESLVRGSDP
jgi:hypothetical protein